MACLGLKAIVRWMAATPLWNGGTLPNDTRAFKDEYTTYDPKRWEAARDAAKDVLEAKDVNGAIRYKLYAPAAMDADDFKDVDGMPIQTMEKYKSDYGKCFKHGCDSTGMGLVYHS